MHVVAYPAEPFEALFRRFVRGVQDPGSLGAPDVDGRAPSFRASSRAHAHVGVGRAPSLHNEQR
jgi:hypothetical protein